MEICSEIAATSGDLRARVNPKYRFEERMHDLTQCLLLDGYVFQEKRLWQIDPSIGDAPPLDDDLVHALKNSGAPHKTEIIERMNDSAQAFRKVPRD